MRVTLKDGTKTTIKRLAANILYEKIAGFCDFSIDDRYERGELTPKQQAEFDRWIEKLLVPIEQKLRKQMGDDFS